VAKKRKLSITLSNSLSTRVKAETVAQRNALTQCSTRFSTLGDMLTRGKRFIENTDVKAGQGRAEMKPSQGCTETHGHGHRTEHEKEYSYHGNRMHVPRTLPDLGSILSFIPRDPESLDPPVGLAPTYSDFLSQADHGLRGSSPLLKFLVQN